MMECCHSTIQNPTKRMEWALGCLNTAIQNGNFALECFMLHQIQANTINSKITPFYLFKFDTANKDGSKVFFVWI